MANILTDTAEWFAQTTSDDVRTAAFDNDFATHIEQSQEYQTASPEVQEAMRFLHRASLEEAEYNSQYNPNNIEAAKNQSHADRVGILEGIWDKAKESHISAGMNIGLISDDLLRGTVDTDTAGNVAKIIAYKNKQAKTSYQKRLDKDIKTLEKRLEKDGFINDAKAWGQFALDIASNPGGVLHTAAESLSSMTAIASGAAAGAAIGSAIPGAGTAVGAIASGAGMFASEMGYSALEKQVEQIKTALEARGITPTASNIQQFFQNNPDFFSKARTKSLEYGAILSSVDLATGGVVGKIATLPTAAARKAAIKGLTPKIKSAIATEAQAAGMTIEEVTDLVVSKKAQQLLKEQSFKSKVGYKAAALTGETASEPLSEYAATTGIGEEATVSDLVYETLGGIGSSPIAAGISTAAFGTKLAKDKTVKETKNFKAKILATPEEKAEVKELKEERKRVAKMTPAKVKAEHGFKEEIAAVTSLDDERITNWSNPEHKDYSPVKAAEAVVQHNDPEAVDKILEIHKPIATKVIELRNQRQAYMEQLINEGKDKNEASQLADKRYTPTINSYMPLLESIGRLHEQAVNQRTAAQNEVNKVTAPLVKNSTEQDVVDTLTKTLGSAAPFNEQIQSVDTTGFSKEVKDLIVSEQRAQTLRSKIASRPQRHDTSRKTSEDVAEDIYHGKAGDDFKGIDGYRDAIGSHLANGNLDKAKQQVEGLSDFRDRHVQKLEALKTLFAAYKRDPSLKKLTAEEQTAQDTLDAISPGMKIQSGTGKIIGFVTEEVAALNAELDVANKLVGIKGNTPVQQQNAIQTVTAASTATSEFLSKETWQIIKNAATNFVNTNADDKRIATYRAKLVEKRGEQAGIEFDKVLAKKRKNPKKQSKAKSKPAPVTNTQVPTKPELTKVLESTEGEQQILGLDTSKGKDTIGNMKKAVVNRIKKAIKRVKKDDYKSEGKLSLTLDDLIEDIQALEKAGALSDNLKTIFSSAIESLVKKHKQTQANTKNKFVTEVYGKEEIQTALANAKQMEDNASNAEHVIINGKKTKAKVSLNTSEFPFIYEHNYSVTQAIAALRAFAGGFALTERQAEFVELWREYNNIQRENYNLAPAEYVGDSILNNPEQRQTKPVQEEMDIETTTKPKAKPEPISKIQAERQDVAGLVKMLGIEINADPNYTGSPEEIIGALTNLMQALVDGTLNAKMFKEQLAWLHTVDVELTEARRTRALKKWEQRAGGNTKSHKQRYIALQAMEELNELLAETLPNNQRIQELLEAQKRTFKIIRFGADTIIKDDKSPYNGMTNANVARDAVKATGVNMAGTKSAQDVIIRLGQAIQNELIGQNTNTESQEQQITGIELEHENATTMSVSYIDIMNEPKTADYITAMEELNDRIEKCNKLLDCFGK